MPNHERHITGQIPLKNARVAVSPSCNIDCVYCDGPKSRKAGRPGAMEDFRVKPLSEGIIDTQDYLNIFSALREAGFRGVNLTGGEPMLNKDWPLLVREASTMGFERVEMTTNGMLIRKYLRDHGSFPEELTLLKVSLDTHDPVRFQEITKVGSLPKIAEGIQQLKETNPDLRVRANKVLVRSDMPDLKSYLDFLEEVGITEVIFLDLILTDGRDPDYVHSFQEEYVYISEAIDWLFDTYGPEVKLEEDRYGYKAYLPNGISVVLKDCTGLTLRDAQCYSCENPCQEGKFTVRVGTDGNAKICFDTRAEMPYIDYEQAQEDGSLGLLMQGLMTQLLEADEVHFFSSFTNHYGAVLVDPPPARFRGE